MSKMGISAVSSYRGAQLFEAVGLAREVVGLAFRGFHRASKAPISRAGAGSESAPAGPGLRKTIEPGGLLKYMHGQEYHAFNPDVVTTPAAGGGWRRLCGVPALLRPGQHRPVATLRDLLKPVEAAQPLSLDEVEPVEKILPRFDSAGMSLGALSPEAHQALAAAMNSLGARSNSGEGGEDPRRFGTERVSKIKQIASGRFGVTPHYLVNAEVLQIKIAQGAKPGEGGQLPGAGQRPDSAPALFGARVTPDFTAPTTTSTRSKISPS